MSARLRAHAEGDVTRAFRARSRAKVASKAASLASERR